MNVAGKIINAIDAELEECFQQFNVADFVSPRGLLAKSNPMFESASRASTGPPHKRGRTLYVCRRAVPDDLFASAANSIFMLMEKDSFTRFQISVRQIRADVGKEGAEHGGNSRRASRPSWTNRGHTKRPSTVGAGLSPGSLGVSIDEARLETALALSSPGGGRHSRHPSLSDGGGMVSSHPLASSGNAVIDCRSSFSQSSAELTSDTPPMSPSNDVATFPSADTPLFGKDASGNGTV